MAAPEVVISLADKHLYVIEDGEELASYPVGVGKPTTPTPAGEFTITSIVKNPPWTVPASILKGKNPPKQKVVPPGPKNPLGVYFLRLNNSSYGIHGTIAPKRLPGAVSHGCVRMKNEDVTELAATVKKGTKVRIIKGPYEDAEDVLPDDEAVAQDAPSQKDDPFVLQADADD